MTLVPYADGEVISICVCDFRIRGFFDAHLECECAAVGHCLDTVYREIHQHLLHLRGIYSRRQLQAALAEFWENHFTTDFDKVEEYLLETDAFETLADTGTPIITVACGKAANTCSRSNLGRKIIELPESNVVFVATNSPCVW